MRTREHVADGSQPLIATDDADLLDDLLRLAAAAGADPHVATTIDAVRSRWARESTVIIGADLAGQLLNGFVPRRKSVVLTARSTDEASAVWRIAADLGAEQVMFLPAAESWLVDRIAAAAVGDVAAAPLVGIVGGSGGAGASVLAAATVHCAAADGLRPVLVDLDPIGAGPAILLGDDSRPGVEWSDFNDSRGRIPGRELLDSLPRTNAIPYLSWGPKRAQFALAAGVVGTVTDSLATAAELIVVDLGRRQDSASLEALCRLDLLVVVVVKNTVGLAAASRLMSCGTFVDTPTVVVVRAVDTTGITSDYVADTLALPLLAELASDVSVGRLIDQGRPPVRRRSALARTAAAVILRARTQRELSHHA